MSETELIEKALAAFAAHIEAEKDLEHGGFICSECGFWLGEIEVTAENRQRHALAAAYPHLTREAREAGRKAGLAEARTKIEGLRANAPAWPDDDSYEAGLDAALASLDEGGTSE